jgi:hypothetical protein
MITCSLDSAHVKAPPAVLRVRLLNEGKWGRLQTQTRFNGRPAINEPARKQPQNSASIIIAILSFVRLNLTHSEHRKGFDADWVSERNLPGEQIKIIDEYITIEPISRCQPDHSGQSGIRHVALHIPSHDLVIPVRALLVSRWTDRE